MAPEKIIEAKNVEKAVVKASETYKIPVDKLKYEVISYGSTGIFGLVGVKKAKIRVVLPEVKKETPKREEPTETVVKEEVVAEEPKETEEKARERTGTQEDTGESRSTGTGQFSGDPIETGQEVLQRIIDRITQDAVIHVEEQEDRIFFNITGGKPAMLIGKRGQTLDAIQYIVEKIVNRHSENRIRLQIDVEGYLENRKKNLEELATRLAEKAKKIGKPVTVGEMNVHDRKIVHLALKDHKHVRTQSIGSGFYRKLLIFPKKNDHRRKKKEN